ATRWARSRADSPLGCTAIACSRSCTSGSLTISIKSLSSLLTIADGVATGANKSPKAGVACFPPSADQSAAQSNGTRRLGPLGPRIIREASREAPLGVLRRSVGRSDLAGAAASLRGRQLGGPHLGEVITGRRPAGRVGETGSQMQSRRARRSSKVDCECDRGGELRGHHLSMQHVGQCLADFDRGRQFGEHWRTGHELAHRKGIARHEDKGNAEACEKFDDRHAGAVAQIVVHDRGINMVGAKVFERALVAWLDSVRGAEAAKAKVVVGGDYGIILNHEDLLAVEIGMPIPRLAIATQHCCAPHGPVQPCYATFVWGSSSLAPLRFLRFLAIWVPPEANRPPA